MQVEYIEKNEYEWKVWTEWVRERKEYEYVSEKADSVLPLKEFNSCRAYSLVDSRGILALKQKA